MAQQKSLTVNFFGRDVSLGKALDGIKKNTFATSNVLEQASRKSSYVLAGLTAAAWKFAQAAAQDEKGAVSLANTLKTVTQASEAQIANVEKYISKSEYFAHIADDELRPAFDTLVRATGNIAKSQSLMNTAMEIAAKQGVSIGEVTNAIAKAQRGQFKALVNLTQIQPKATKAATVYGSSMKVVNGQLKTVQTTLGKTQKSTESLDAYMKRAGATFKGSIAAQAGTASYAIDGMRIAFDNASERLGYALIPYMLKFSDWLTKHEEDIPKWTDAIFTWGKRIFFAAAAFKAFNAAFKAIQFARLIGNLMGVGTAAAAAGSAGAAGGVAISAAWAPFFAGVLAIGGLAALGAFAYNMWQNRNMKVDKGKPGSFLNPNIAKPYNSSALGSNVTLPTFSSLYGRVPKMAQGGIVTKPTIAMIGEAGPEAVVPLGRGGAGGVTIINYIQGSVVTEKELSLKIRNDMAQLLRRKGINPSVLGV